MLFVKETVSSEVERTGGGLVQRLGVEGLTRPSSVYSSPSVDLAPVADGL